jgi:hypothetical protein
MRYLLVLTVALLASCGPPWAVLVQSGPPSAVSGAQSVSYAADFSQVLVDGHPFGAEPPNEQQSLSEAFANMDQHFLEEFSGRMMVPVVPANAPPGPGEVRMSPVFVEVVRGTRGPIGFAATELRTRFRWTIGGQVTDEVEVYCKVSPALTRPSVAGRLNSCAQRAGRQAAQFFERANRQ